MFKRQAAHMPVFLFIVMIITLTFNSSLDYVAHTDSTKEGQIHKISDYEVYPGGKGINVSQILNELDVANEAWGYVAGVTGNSIEALLDEKKVNHNFIHLKEGITRINVKLRSDKEESVVETDFNGVGPVISDSEIKEMMGMLNTLTKDDILIISGSIPASISEEVFNEMLEVVSKKDVKLVADVTGKYLKVALKHKPFLIKPNEDEVNEFLNIKIENGNVKDAAKKLKEMGAVNVLISLGENGAYLLAEAGEFSMLPPRGKVVNTVGAGDSMVAGFVAGYLKEEDFNEALKLAICAGSATAFSKGLATKEDIKGLFI